MSSARPLSKHGSHLVVLSAMVLLCSSTVRAEKYWIYDAEQEFTSSELYMMSNCGSCAPQKHFAPVSNPPGVPVLSDQYSTNGKFLEMSFPGCQFSTSENFCQKCMSQPANQTQFPYGTDIWQAFSVFVPASYSHDPDWNLIYQFHAHPDDVGTCDQWRSPPFAIGMQDTDKWTVYGRHSAVQCNTDGNGSVTMETLQNTQPVVKDGWTHFVMHLRFDHAGNGRSRVWIRDDAHDEPLMIADYTGPLGFNDAEAPYDYVSFGYYYGQNSGPDVTLYFDRIIFGDDAESLASMMYQETQPCPDCDGGGAPGDAGVTGGADQGVNDSGAATDGGPIADAGTASADAHPEINDGGGDPGQILEGAGCAHGRQNPGPPAAWWPLLLLAAIVIRFLTS